MFVCRKASLSNWQWRKVLSQIVCCCWIEFQLELGSQYQCCIVFYGSEHVQRIVLGVRCPNVKLTRRINIECTESRKRVIASTCIGSFNMQRFGNGVIPLFCYNLPNTFGKCNDLFTWETITSVASFWCKLFPVSR